MEKDQIKKVLYKEKVEAKFEGATATSIHYSTECSLGKITFIIPTFECTDEMFERLNIKAALLIRWIH